MKAYASIKMYQAFNILHNSCLMLLWQNNIAVPLERIQVVGDDLEEYAQ